MKNILLSIFAILIANNVFAVEAWEKTYTPLRTLYVTPNANGGKLLNTTSGDYEGHEDNAWINQAVLGNGIISGGYDLRGNVCGSIGNCEPFIKLKFPSGVFTDHTFSVVGWFKTRVNGVLPDNAYVLSTQDTTNSSNNARVQIQLLNTGQIRGTFVGDTVGAVTLTSTGALENDAQWHMFALVEESATSHKLYVDNAAALTSATSTDTYAEMDRMVINPNFSLSTFSGNFDGSVDEFQFYNVALSSSQILDLFNNGSGTQTPEAGIVAQYHMDEAAHGTEDNRIDFDEINGHVQAGDEVLLEVVNPSPDGYISDRIDLDVDGIDNHWGNWYDLTTSGTLANPIVYKCESGWPSDCRFTARIDLTASHNWLWGVWITGKQGANVTNCQIGDDGPDGLGVAGSGNVMINNWFYHPANFPSYNDTDPPTWNGSTEGGAGAFNSQTTTSPASIWYGNTFYLAGHSTYTQNNASAGYLYYVRNIISSPREATYSCESGGSFAVDHKMGGFWSSSTNVSKMFIYQNFFTDQTGERRGQFFHVSDGEPSQQSIIDNNEFWCGGRMVGTPANGSISTASAANCTGTTPAQCATAQGRPQQLTFTDNFAASCYFEHAALWGTGELRYTQLEQNVITGNTILMDPALGSLNASARTLSYTTALPPGGLSFGITSIQPTTVWDGNTYETNARFELRADNVELTNRTLAQWRSDTDAHNGAGAGFDLSSTTMDFPTTGARVVIYPNFYDPTVGELMIYNWEEAATVDVDFGTVCPMCSRFNLYDTTLRPDDPPVLSNQIWLGTDIPVPMEGEIVRTFRIRILN